MDKFGEEEEMRQEIGEAIQTSLIAVFDAEPNTKRPKMIQVCWFPQSEKGWYTTYVWEDGKLSAIAQDLEWTEHYKGLVDQE